MTLSELLVGLRCLNLQSLSLMLRHPSNLRPYVSACSRKYDELAGNGLPCGIVNSPRIDSTITLPAWHSGGGMTFTEQVVLARTISTLSPASIFEIGSYDGLTTALFLLNSPPNARIFTLDLPPENTAAPEYLDSDTKLVQARQLGSIPKALGLSAYTQLLCDSLTFDPSPYANSIYFGLVDAAHDRLHVESDTKKMIAMMKDEGIIFWHDYGGLGSLRPLALYLEELGRRCDLRRIPDTSFAWARAKDLRAAVGESARS